MFKLIYKLKEVGEYQTFREAFKELYERLTKETEEMLSTIFIEHKIGDVECPLDFFGARDLACQIGLLKEGKLQEGSSISTDEGLIEIAFVRGKIAATAEALKTLAIIAQLKS